MKKKKSEVKIRIHFSQIFGIGFELLESYGAFDISLVNDLPVFIDPFLLFNSDKPEYQALHEEVIAYVSFLRDEAEDGALNDHLIRDWFTFPEVKQNWLGFCKKGNGGRGLGMDFAKSLHLNLNRVFRSFGKEKITRGTHLEKLCLLRDGVGRDNISDFTTNLIKHFLCEYTQVFAQQHLAPTAVRRVAVSKAKFNYETKTWMTRTYELPYANGDYVLLTPKDLLTKDDSWINREELIWGLPELIGTLQNQVLRSQLDRYLRDRLDKRAKAKQRRAAYSDAVDSHPEIIEYYIKLKEELGSEASSLSHQKVVEALQMFVMHVQQLANLLHRETDFYETAVDSLQAARRRVDFLKDVIENKDGYRIFYVDGKPIQREEDLQILYRLTWFASICDVNREVNNGRGPVDFKVSRGALDKSLVEMKLASNKKLKQNLANQVAVYERANNTHKSITVILHFGSSQKRRVDRILKELKLSNSSNYVLIDASRNKASASNVR